MADRGYISPSGCAIRLNARRKRSSNRRAFNVFELKRANGGWTFTVLYRLSGWGISGSYRNLLLVSGKIYASTHCDGTNNAGTVYELTDSGTTWTYKPLYVLNGSSNGLYSISNLVADSQGNLYGTTLEGGANGSGVVFKVTP